MKNSLFPVSDFRQFWGREEGLLGPQRPARMIDAAPPRMPRWFFIKRAPETACENFSLSLPWCGDQVEKMR